MRKNRSERRAKKQISQKKEQKIQKKLRDRAPLSPSFQGKPAWIIMLVVVFMAIVVIVSFAIACYNMTKMEEISIDDETVQELTGRYFYGDNGCFSHDASLLNDGKKKVGDLTQEEKERILTDYLIYVGKDGLTYEQMNYVFKEFFGKNNNLSKKLQYVGSDGSLTNYREDAEAITDTDEYYLDKDCGSVPEIITCIVLKKAYKTVENDDYMKLVFNVFTIDTANLKVYSGVDTSKDEAMAYEEFEEKDISEIDFDRWEAIFKYDDIYEKYRLVETTKIGR